MASMHYSTIRTLSLFLMLIIPLFSPSLASISTSTPISPDTICNLTPFPFLCKSLLPHNQFTTIPDCTRISIHHSLETTRNLRSSVDAYLGFPYALPQTAIRALQDCHFLIGLNMDFLSNVIQGLQAIDDSTNTLQRWQAEEIHTLLSAILTNQQTCSDGLQATSSSIQSALLAPFYNINMLYRVSLSLFRHGNWVLDRKEGQRQRKDKFSDFSIDKVKVSQKVVVSKDGSGNFTNINDAVAAAPNNTGGRDGYFLIYVVAGVYEEYVSVGKNKKYFMMVGDGINKTLITGNRSVVDGWTTFNSATFGKFIDYR